MRAAEKKLVPVVRESVGLDAEGLSNLVLLVERGVGKRTNILREALGSGLRVMVQGTTPLIAPESSVMQAPWPAAWVPAEVANAGGLGHGRALVAVPDVPVLGEIVPPSQARREGDVDDGA